jgi:hypothetical protein
MLRLQRTNLFFHELRCMERGLAGVEGTTPCPANLKKKKEPTSGLEPLTSSHYE